MSNTYLTGNPIGSTDPRDLYDNASNFDDGMNTASPSFTDRLGVLRKTWNGMETEFNLAQSGREAEFQQFLTDSGFVSLGNYAAGLNFTAYHQYMARDGFFYRPAPSSIPFTTTGTWVSGDENLFNLFSADDVLRQDLASDSDQAKGAGQIGFDQALAYPAGTAGEAIVDRALIGGFLGDSFEYGPDQPEAQFAVPTGPSIRRQRCTTQDLEIFVDAAASPGGDGSQLAPYQSINQAIEDVPREIYHMVRIYLTDGVYVGPGNEWNLFNYFVTPVSVAGFQIIGHVPENPLYADTNIAAVVLGDASGLDTTSNFVIGGVQGDADDTKMIGVTVDGRVQIYGGLFAFDRCNFKTGRNGNLVDGHSGRAKFTACDFSNCANGLNATDLAMFFLASCTGSALTTTYSVRNGSFLSTELCVALNALGATVVEGNSIAKLEGRILTLNTTGNAWGIARSDNGVNLLSTSNAGDVIAKQALVGGAGGALSLPGNDTFGIYDVAGDLFLRVDVAGTLKTLKIYDFATNVWV